MKTVTRAGLLDFQDTDRKPFKLPELNGEVYLAKLTAAEAHQLGKEASSTPYAVRVVIAGTAGEDGDGRMFTEADAEKIGKLPAAMIGPLAAAILEFNGIQLDGTQTSDGD